MPKAPPSAAEIVLTFLESVGLRAEAEFYLRLFRTLPKQSFALISVRAPVVRYALGSLTEQLRFLADLDLFAPIVLGLFNPTLSEQSADRFVRRLPSVGLEPCLHDAREPGLSEALARELGSAKVPVVRFSPEAYASAQARFERLGELARELDSRKLVLVRRRGGFQPRGDGRFELSPGAMLPVRFGKISIINLLTDASLLRAQKQLRKEDEELLGLVEPLLAAPESSRMLVNVTSPLNLLKELFTIRGAGTLIKSGSNILRHESYAALDRARLTHLLEASFGRPLLPALFERPLLGVYLEANYRGAALLEPSPVAPFLSKFAVEPAAQGEGLGQDLWHALRRDHPSVYWRARPHNPINAWYAQISDGMLRRPDWHVFWHGLEPERIAEVVTLACEHGTDFAG